MISCRCDNVNEMERFENICCLTVAQVAKLLQVSPQWVYRNWSKIGGVKLVGKLRFDRRIVERRFRELN